MDDAAVGKSRARTCCALCPLHTKNLTECQGLWATSHWIDPKNQCRSYTVIHLTVKGNKKDQNGPCVASDLCQVTVKLRRDTELMTNFRLTFFFACFSCTNRMGLIHSIVWPDTSNMKGIGKITFRTTCFFKNLKISKCTFTWLNYVTFTML